MTTRVSVIADAVDETLLRAVGLHVHVVYFFSTTGADVEGYAQLASKGAMSPPS